MIGMNLTHCPLCVGLAVMAALRFCAHGWLLASSGLLQRLVAAFPALPALPVGPQAMAAIASAGPLAERP